jgi:hypothetical protein
METRQFATGAVPPPGARWQLGETAPANPLTETAQPTASSIDTVEFRRLLSTHVQAFTSGTIPQTSASWASLVDYIDKHVADNCQKACGYVVNCRCAIDAAQSTLPAARAALALPSEAPAFSRPSAGEAAYEEARTRDGVVYAGVFDKAWSRDRENFNCNSLEELITKHGDTLEAGQVVYFGGVRRPTMHQLCDADAVLDHMANNAADIAGEYAEGFPNVSKEAKDELDGLLGAWCDKHCDINFFEVVVVKPYKITKKDLSLGSKRTLA